eukprot:c36724_g1_i1 orf=554-766(+)
MFFSTNILPNLFNTVPASISSLPSWIHYIFFLLFSSDPFRNSGSWLFLYTCHQGHMSGQISLNQTIVQSG